MISFLEGKIEYLGDKYIILNAGGIGYKVTMIPKVLSILSKSQPVVNPALERDRGSKPEGEIPFKGGVKPRLVRLFIRSQLNMREGTFDMYGFEKKDDLDLFNLLTTVSGIGPKGAINIMASIEPSHLKAAVINEDSDYIRKVSTLGAKTAQKLIIELKNKVDFIDIGGQKALYLGDEGHAVEALMSLGYSQFQAKDALKEVSSKTKTLEQRVREALRLLGKK